MVGGVEGYVSPATPKIDNGEHQRCERNAIDPCGGCGSFAEAQRVGGDVEGK